jgi:hypothetical protein
MRPTIIFEVRLSFLQKARDRSPAPCRSIRFLSGRLVQRLSLFRIDTGQANNSNELRRPVGYCREFLLAFDQPEANAISFARVLPDRDDEVVFFNPLHDHPEAIGVAAGGAKLLMKSVGGFHRPFDHAFYVGHFRHSNLLGERVSL